MSEICDKELNEVPESEASDRTILAMGHSEGLSIKPDGFFARLLAARERDDGRIAKLAEENKDALDRLA